VQLNFCTVGQLNELLDLPRLQKVRVGELSLGGWEMSTTRHAIAPCLDELVIHTITSAGRNAVVSQLPYMDVSEVQRFQLLSLQNFDGYPYEERLGLLGRFGSLIRG
jgi:hypothetical protein